MPGLGRVNEHIRRIGEVRASSPPPARSHPWDERRGETMGFGRVHRAGTWVALIGSTAAIALGASASAASAPQIEVLSNRADVISAGDALVAVALPAPTDPSKVVVRLGGRDVSSEFATRENGRFE